MEEKRRVFAGDYQGDRTIMKKINVLQINKLYSPWIGGIESVAKTLSSGLSDEMGMKVLVCQPKGRGVIESIDGTEVIRAGSIGIKFSMPISFSFPFLVRKYAKEADVIILHDPFPLGDLAVLLSGFKGKVIVYWHSDIIKQKRLVKLIKPVINGILKRADAIFTTTEGYIEGSAYIKRYRDKCRLVPYGIDPKEYLDIPLKPILTEQLRDKSCKKILFAGRLIYYKGVDILLNAFKQTEGAELFIVGKGKDEEALKLMAEGFAERVHFMGTLSDEDLKSAFSDCDFFVLPSVEKSEAFGIVQLEAMIYGKPVINTDLKTSVPLVSIDSKTGLTVKPGDADSLANAMNVLIHNDNIREDYGKAAKERVLSSFTLDSMMDNAKKQIKDIVK